MDAMGASWRGARVGLARGAAMAARLETTRSPLENILLDLKLWKEENMGIYQGGPQMCAGAEKIKKKREISRACSDAITRYRGEDG